MADVAGDAEHWLTKHRLHRTVWGTRIIRVEREGGGFRMSEVREAGDWPTCACGRVDPRIPRYANCVPMDLQLEMLGIDFYDAISDEQVVRAAELLVEIEQRAQEVLQELKHDA